MLLHWLAGLGSYAWEGNAHSDCECYSDNNGNPVGHPIDNERAIPHPQLAYCYSDIYPHYNTYTHDHTYPCTFVDTIPATHVDVYPHLDTHPADGDLYSHSADIHLYPHPAHGDIYSLTSPTKRNSH